MKLVRENIEFKRGINPKEALEIGKYKKIEKPIDWDSLAPGIYKIFNLAPENEAAHIEIKEDRTINYVTEWEKIGYPISLISEENRKFRLAYISYDYIQMVSKIGEVY